MDNKSVSQDLLFGRHHIFPIFYLQKIGKVFVKVYSEGEEVKRKCIIPKDFSKQFHLLRKLNVQI